MYTLADQPQSILGIIANSFRVYKSVLLKILPFSLIYTAIIIAPQAAFIHAFSSEPNKSHVALYGFSVLCFFLGVWLTAVMYSRINLFMIHDPRGLNASYATAFRQFLACAISSAVYFIVIFLGMIALLLPGIFLSIWFCFYFVAIIVDKLDVVSSLKQSAKLVNGNWWRTFGVLLISSVISIIILKVAERLSGSPIFFITHTSLVWKLIHAHLFTFVLLALLQPWLMAVMLCQYYDLKLRHCSGLRIED